LNQRERDRLAVLRQVGEGMVSAVRGAELVGLTSRQFRRLRRRWEAEGDGAVIHRLRGRGSNRSKARVIRERAMRRALEPVFDGFGPTLLAEHLSRDPEIGPLSAFTLRGWMIQEGLWTPRRHRPRHRNSRPRRAAFGELIQWDSSEHAWFEERVPGRFMLIKMMDDATNRLMMVRFVPRDAQHRARPGAFPPGQGPDRTRFRHLTGSAREGAASSGDLHAGREATASSRTCMSRTGTNASPLNRPRAGTRIGDCSSPSTWSSSSPRPGPGPWLRTSRSASRIADCRFPNVRLVASAQA